MEYEAKLNDCKTKTAPYFGHSLKCSNFPAFMLERHDENNKNQRTLIMCVVNKFTTVNIKTLTKTSANAYARSAKECGDGYRASFHMLRIHERMVKWHVNSIVT